VVGSLPIPASADGSPGRETTGLVILALAADDKSGGAAVATVQDPAQLVILFDKGIRFIDQQGRLRGFDDAKGHRRGEVGRGQGPAGQLVQQGEQSGLAAAFLRRGDRQARAGFNVKNLFEAKELAHLLVLGSRW